jgi:predicted GNAT superfamily acetyltransferase
VSAGAGFSIRPVSDFEELERAVAFQHLIWGPGFTEAVPAAILVVANHTGGIVAGAFDDAGDLVGFLFGITGFRDGQPLHWSDMLGVRPDMRSRGVGQALKRYQRDVLLDRGVRLVRWTFDPLEARNAFLNFAKLGCTAREYVRDCYGMSTSPLHIGLGTDRLIVDWQLDSAAVRQRMDGPGHAAPIEDAAVRAMPVANPAGTGPARLDLDAPAIRMRIPHSIQDIRDDDARTAREWRATTRAVLESYLGRGYTVTDVVRGSDGASS